MTTALHAEAERPPRVSTQNFVPTPSPIRPPVRRIWASLPLASSPQDWTPLTALRFRSVRYCIIRLLPDAPSRVVRCCERPCLVDDGFPPSGPQEDLTTTCLTSLFCVHAEHTKALRPPAAVRCAQPCPVLPPRPQYSYATKADLRRPYQREYQREGLAERLTRRFLLDGGVQIRLLASLPLSSSLSACARDSIVMTDYGPWIKP